MQNNERSDNEINCVINDDLTYTQLMVMFSYTNVVLVIDKDVTGEELPEWFRKLKWAHIISLSPDVNNAVDKNFDFFNGYKRFSILNYDVQADLPVEGQKYLFCSDDKYYDKNRKLSGKIQSLMGNYFKYSDFLLLWIGTSGCEESTLILEETIGCIGQNRALKTDRKKIVFFGLSEDNDNKNKEKFYKSDLIVKHSGIEIYEYEPYHYISEEDVQEIDENKRYYFDSKLFYINSNEHYFDEKDGIKDMLTSISWITLVSQDDMYERNDRLIGSYDRKYYFMKFLEDSSEDCAQWYGYSQRAGFFMKRQFSDELYKKVSEALDKQSKTIICYGPPASSKSMSLGYVAYKVFNEHKYPVLVIRQSVEQSNEIIDDSRKAILNRIIEEINAVENTKVLIVWDSHDLDKVKEVRDYLVHKGRSFVILTCSYETAPDNTENAFVYVASDRKDDQLPGEFRRIYNEFFSDRIEISSEDELKPYDIVDFIFLLNKKLDRFFRSGLDMEKNVIMRYLDSKMCEIYSNRMKEKKHKSPGTIGSMIDLNKLLGFESSDTVEDEIKQSKKLTASKQAVEEFQLYTAMFSYFDIWFPESFAVACLNSSLPEDENSERDRHTVYTTETNTRSEIYDLISEGIPWIKRSVKEYSCSFSFRKTVEAQIYIDDHFGLATGKSVKEYIETICEIMDRYNSYGCKDPAIVKCISKLLREVGPNHRNNSDPKIKCARDYANENLPKIIEKIKEITEQGLDHEHELFILWATFCREYYSGKCCTDVAARKEGLYTTITKEQKRLYAISEIDNRGYNSSRAAELAKNNIITELANCIYDYLNLFGKDNKWEGFEFQTMFTWLEKAIRADRTNGYYYIAFLKLFLKWKEFKPNEHLVEKFGARIYDLLNYTDTLEIKNQGGDELGNKKSDFYAAMKGLNIDLELAEKQGEGWEQLSAFFSTDRYNLIGFVCNKELRKVLDAHNNERPFDQNDIEKLQRIKDYLQQNYKEVKKSTGTLFLLFRVLFCLYLKMDIRDKNAQKERIPLDLGENEWREIHGVCKDYSEHPDFKNSKGEINYRAAYMYALSSIYVNPFDMKECERLQNKFFSNELLLKGAGINNGSRMSFPFLLSVNETVNGEITDYNEQSKDGRMTITFTVGDTVIEQKGVLFNKRDIAEYNRAVSVKDIIKDLCIGVGYQGFRAFKKSILAKRRERSDEQH